MILQQEKMAAMDAEIATSQSPRPGGGGGSGGNSPAARPLTTSAQHRATSASSSPRPAAAAALRASMIDRGSQPPVLPDLSTLVQLADGTDDGAASPPPLPPPPPSGVTHERRGSIS